MLTNRFFKRKNPRDPGMCQKFFGNGRLTAPAPSTIHIGVLDHSGSMACEDYAPTRLKAGMAGFDGFADTRRACYPDDKIGLVIFNDSARSVFSPQCIGHPDFMDIMRQKMKGIRAEGGTNLELGLQEALTLIISISNPYIYFPCRLLVLTDGHSGGDPKRISQTLKQEGMVIEIVGIGGSPAAVNEPLLKQCASVEHGKLLYRFIGDGDSEGLAEHFEGIALK